MTGQINVNKIAARTGTTVSIDTGDALDVTLVKGEGTATTDLRQGLAKMWVNYTGISSTAARDSFNVSSLTDNGTGQTTVNINNDMANANYSGYYFTSASTGTAYTNFGNAYTGGFGSFATGSCGQNAYTSTNFDSYQNLVGIFGDLA